MTLLAEITVFLCLEQMELDAERALRRETQQEAVRNRTVCTRPDDLDEALGVFTAPHRCLFAWVVPALPGTGFGATADQARGGPRLSTRRCEAATPPNRAATRRGAVAHW